MRQQTHPAAQSDIDRDLVRWPRAKWLAIILLVLVIQGALFLKMPSPVVPASHDVGKQTAIHLANDTGLPSEAIEIQDPTLFAGARSRGFSGVAWMNTPRWREPAEAGLPPVEFLAYPGLDGAGTGDTEISFPTVAHGKLEPQPTPLEIPTRIQRPNSHLVVEGWVGRGLLTSPALPIQYATDVLRPSIVQALVDAEGMVFSARLLNSSGSRGADIDALVLARKLQFERKQKADPENDEIETGKLVFEWETLDPGVLSKKGNSGK